MNETSIPKAHVVRVHTERLGGGRPMLVLYIAGFPTPEAAQEGVREFLGRLDGDEIGEATPVSDETARSLGATPGSVHML
jgi:hypothetical protein